MDAQSARGLAVWHLKRFLCCSAWRGLAQLQRERAHRFLLADVQVQGGRRGDNGLQLHQLNRLQAVASAVNHIPKERGALKALWSGWVRLEGR